MFKSGVALWAAVLAIALVAFFWSLSISSPLSGAKVIGGPMISEYADGGCDVTQTWNHPPSPNLTTTEYLYEGPCDKIPQDLRDRIIAEELRSQANVYGR